MLVQTMHPSNAQCSGLRSVTKKQKKNTIFSHLQLALIVHLPKLCTVVDLIVPIIKGATIFQSNS